MQDSSISIQRHLSAKCQPCLIIRDEKNKKVSLYDMESQIETKLWSLREGNGIDGEIFKNTRKINKRLMKRLLSVC